ncbi:amidase [Microtetraspora fusca]|uniref:Amidase n=1 Tax=Microtetraspora fusca TaxID=1997 RepID=A0ABW6V283_MICFU
MVNPTDMTLLEQAAAVRERRISPVELVNRHLERIERYDGGLAAYATVDEAGARRAAKEAEQKVMAGADLPPLHGVPVSVKDTWPVAGLRFSAGSRAFVDRVAPVDAAVVTALREAGTVILGTTNAAEFGCSSYTETFYGAARSPYDPARGAGGSSGGAAASVAAGLAAGALGSDGGGSVRIPAASCGIVGIKPSRGRVTPAPGTDALGLGTAGPLARTVADAAALLDVMSGSLPGDAGTLPPAPDGCFRASADRDPGRLRIGVLPPAGGTAEPCRTAAGATADLLSELGHDVSDAPHAGPDDYRDFFTVLWTTLAAAVPVPEDKEGELLDLTRWLREEGRRYSASDLATALARMQVKARELGRRFAEFDVLLSPTLTGVPPEVGALVDSRDPARTYANMLALVPHTPLFNITGQPSVSLPLHWTADGLPIGIMLTGRVHHEAALISLAAQMERALPWHDRRPRLAAEVR